MRRILVDNARRKRSRKPAATAARQDLDDLEIALCRDAGRRLLALDEALDKLAADGQDGGRAGQAPLLRRAATPEKRPQLLGISPATGGPLWAYARAWLHQRDRGRHAATVTFLKYPGVIRPRDSALKIESRKTAMNERASSWPPGEGDAGRGVRLPGRSLRRRCGVAPAGRGIAQLARAGRQLPGSRSAAPGARTGGSRRRLRPQRKPEATSRRPPLPATRHGHRAAPSTKRPGTVIGPYKLLAADRRRRHGRRLHGRADAAGAAQGRPQGHQAGHGQPPGHRPLRGRAAGPGHDGPCQHRPRPRRRGHGIAAGRTSSWSWSTACRSPSTATTTT